MIFGGQESDYYHSCNATGPIDGRAQIEIFQQKVDYSARNAGKRIYLLAENERLLIDEDVAQNAAAGACNRAYHHRDNGRATHIKRFGHTKKCKNGKSDGIEQEYRACYSVHQSMEKIVQNQRPGNYQQRHQIIKPERSDAQHDISDCSASDGRNESHDEQSEKIKSLSGGQTDTANGKRERTDDFNPIHHL